MQIRGRRSSLGHLRGNARRPVEPGITPVRASRNTWNRLERSTISLELGQGTCYLRLTTSFTVLACSSEVPPAERTGGAMATGRSSAKLVRCR